MRLHRRLKTCKNGQQGTNINPDGEENPHTEKLKTIKEEIQQMSEKLNADEVALRRRKKSMKDQPTICVF